MSIPQGQVLLSIHWYDLLLGTMACIGWTLAIAEAFWMMTLAGPPQACIIKQMHMR